MRVAVMVSGTGSNLRALYAHTTQGTVEARIGLVISDRDCEALAFAKEQGIPAVRLGRRGQLRDVLAGEAPDLVVLAGYMRIVPADVCTAFAGRIVNLHPSLLPAFPGADGIGDAHRAGVRITGCTTHLVTPELDAGPILLQAATTVGKDEADTRRRVQALEHRILPRTVQLFAEGRVQGARIRPGPSWGTIEGAIVSDGY